MNFYSRDLEASLKHFLHVKKDTIDLNFKKNKSELQSFDKIAIQTVNGKKEYYAPWISMKQGINSLCGRYANSTVNFINSGNPRMYELGLQLLNEKITTQIGKTCIARILDNQILGFVSDNYKHVASYDLCEKSLDVFGENNFHSAFSNLNRDIMEFKLGKIYDALDLEWDLLARIENNEFGRHHIGIGLSLSRTICTNGLTINEIIDSIKTKHYGKVSLTNIEKQLLNLDISKFNFEKLVNETLVEIEDPDSFFEKLRTKYNLSKIELIDIQDYQKKEEEQGFRGNTIYGISNAIARYANDFAIRGNDKYYQLQEIAGSIMNMSIPYNYTIH